MQSMCDLEYAGQSFLIGGIVIMETQHKVGKEASQYFTKTFHADGRH